MTTTKIGVLCDLHLSKYNTSAQHAFLQKAIERMQQDNITTVICLGDITSFGEISAWNDYQEALSGFTHYEVLGNSDVRDSATIDFFLSKTGTADFMVGNRRVIGLDTPYGEITDIDRQRLNTIKDGDVLFLHHYISSLNEESRNWLTALIHEKTLTVLHGHGHRIFDEKYNHTQVWGMRGLDPEKAIGGYPSFNYLIISDDEIKLEECPLTASEQTPVDASRYFGLSCVDNHRDVLYALEHGIKYIELRCNGNNWKPEADLLPLLDAWRKKTCGYLSIHMPNLKWTDSTITGKEQWQTACEYAVLTGADGLTIHPPRIRLAQMPQGKETWNEFLEQYVKVAKTVPSHVKIGIENLHLEKNDTTDENRPFGCTTTEVSLWIDAINQALEQPGRVGHVLDVGHARRNKVLTQMYPISRWFDIMGQETVAYHIHQVATTEKGMTNHLPITSWFGPFINYTAFFHCWETGQLNHVPIFLEVKGSENFAASIQGFADMLATAKQPTLLSSSLPET